VRSGRRARIGSCSACGAGLSGKPSSTIGFERRFNRVLSVGRQEFVDTIAVVTTKPSDSIAVLEFNRGNALT
jgi:hydroxyacylglutathione hydrolase